MVIFLDCIDLGRLVDFGFFKQLLPIWLVSTVLPFDEKCCYFVQFPVKIGPSMGFVL
jgi:hypothetical protein